MGLEGTYKIDWQNGSTRARVHLDSNKLDVYLKPVLHVAFADMRKVTARDGVLRIDLADGPLVLHLGAAAERWALKITQPKGRLDKLGVKRADMITCWLGERDPSFHDELEQRLERVHTKIVKGAELVFVRVAKPKDFDKLPAVRTALAPAGAVWVVREKGKAAPVREADVRAAAKAAGLADVKVVSFSETLTADKFVIPVAKR